jgi:hypothetical protein
MMMMLPGRTNVIEYPSSNLIVDFVARECTSAQGYKSLLGFLAPINPTPPASFTTSAALITALRVIEVKQRTTFPDTIEGLTERD